MDLPTEGPLDVLYTVAPAQFVAERDALARRLRGEGESALAKQAEAMRRPTASVWAVNQAARGDGARVEALLEAAARLRREQGAGDADSLREAIQAHRTALRALVEAAEAALHAAGIRGEHTRAIETDLQSAAAGSREQREQLRAGRLASDLIATGFDALSPAAAAAAPRAQPPAPHENVAQKKREEQERLEAKRRDLQERASAAEAARKRAELKRALHAAEAEAHRLEARFRGLDAKAERAEVSARAARAEAEAARAELAAAADRVGELRRSLGPSE